jgi:hypothetical protein
MTVLPGRTLSYQGQAKPEATEGGVRSRNAISAESGTFLTARAGGWLPAYRSTTTEGGRSDARAHWAGHYDSSRLGRFRKVWRVT